MRKPIVVLATAAMALAACTPGPGNKPKPKAPGSVNTDIAKNRPRHKTYSHGM